MGSSNHWCEPARARVPKMQSVTISGQGGGQKTSSCCLKRSSAIGTIPVGSSLLTGSQLCMASGFFSSGGDQHEWSATCGELSSREASHPCLSLLEAYPPLYPLTSVH